MTSCSILYRGDAQYDRCTPSTAPPSRGKKGCFMDPRNHCPSKGVQSYTINCCSRLALHECGVQYSVSHSKVGHGDVAAFGLPRVFDHPSSSFCRGVYWPKPGVNPRPVARGMPTAKLVFLRLSNFRTVRGSSSSWQGFHHGLLPRSCDSFDLPALHQMEIVN